MYDRDLALKERIMGKIYLIWMIRMLIHPTILKTVIVLVLFWRSTQYVSYSNVFANAPTLSDISSSLHFSQDALLNTETATLYILSGIALVGFWLLADVIRARSAHDII